LQAVPDQGRAVHGRLLSLAQVVKTSVFLKYMGDFGAMNEVYARYFPADPPARSTVAAAGLPRDVLVEIDVIALAS
jgi:2-iminobutanoate/2-iminopropanoate deaminase